MSSSEATPTQYECQMAHSGAKDSCSRSTGSLSGKRNERYSTYVEDLGVFVVDFGGTEV
jgi:hypothetical protein